MVIVVWVVVLVVLTVVVGVFVLFIAVVIVALVVVAVTRAVKMTVEGKVVFVGSILSYVTKVMCALY